MSRSHDRRQAREALDEIDMAVLAMTGDVEVAEAHTRKYHELAEVLTDPDGYLPDAFVDGADGGTLKR